MATKDDFLWMAVKYLVKGVNLRDNLWLNSMVHFWPYCYKLIIITVLENLVAWQALFGIHAMCSLVWRSYFGATVRCIREFSYIYGLGIEICGERKQETVVLFYTASPWYVRICGDAMPHFDYTHTRTTLVAWWVFRDLRIISTMYRNTWTVTLEQLLKLGKSSRALLLTFYSLAKDIQ